MRQKQPFLLILGSLLALILFIVSVMSVAGVLQSEPPILTTPIPPPPDTFSTEPDPTIAPLAKPLSEEEALRAALELDRYTAVHLDASADSPAAVATATLYKSRAEADKAVGLQTWYAPDIEADLGEVWVVAIPGPMRVISGPGMGGEQGVVYDGIAYKFSARTGELLGVTTGPPQDD